MGKRGKQTTFQLTVGEDPALWQFSSVEEALRSNLKVLAQLVHSGEPQRKDASPSLMTEEPISEGGA